MVLCPDTAAQGCQSGQQRLAPGSENPNAKGAAGEVPKIWDPHHQSLTKMDING